MLRARDLWGANAVNGVINIITRNAGNSQGSFVSAAAGNEDRLIAAYRYGGRLGDKLAFRVSGRLAHRDDSERPDGEDFNDEWRQGVEKPLTGYFGDSSDGFRIGDVCMETAHDGAIEFGHTVFVRIRAPGR